MFSNSFSEAVRKIHPLCLDFKYVLSYKVEMNDGTELTLEDDDRYKVKERSFLENVAFIRAMIDSKALYVDFKKDYLETTGEEYDMITDITSLLILRGGSIPDDEIDEYRGDDEPE